MRFRVEIGTNSMKTENVLSVWVDIDGERVAHKRITFPLGESKLRTIVVEGGDVAITLVDREERG